MKTAEQIADNVIRNAGKNVGARPLIIAALKEYGELVRQRAAGVARDHQPRPLTVGGIIERESCAAAIERMELP